MLVTRPRGAGAARAAVVAAVLVAVLVVGGLGLAGCGGARSSPRSPLVDSAPMAEGDGSGRLRRELELEVLASYQRTTLDAPAAAAAIDPAVGLIMFGIGPDDFVAARALDQRWPITAQDGQAVEVVSRHLELFLSADRTVGWSYDEVSLRLAVCGRIASIPLRVSQVYVRDSERWTQVAEHVAYVQPMARWRDAARGPEGTRIPTAIEKQLESQAAQATLAEALAPDADRASWDGGAGGLAIWPDPLHVLRAGGARSGPSLAQSLGATGITVEGLRLALGPGRTVAIAGGTLVARLDRVREGADDPVEVRLRGTFVLERRNDTWQIRLAMVSVPITTSAMVSRMLGAAAAVEAGGRIRVGC